MGKGRGRNTFCRPVSEAADPCVVYVYRLYTRLEMGA